MNLVVEGLDIVSGYHPNSPICQAQTNADSLEVSFEPLKLTLPPCAAVIVL